MRELHSSRGIFGDFDNDDMDILIMNMNDRPCCAQRYISGSHWLKVLTGVESNRSAIGAQVAASWRTGTGGSGNLFSVSDRRLAFLVRTETEAKRNSDGPTANQR